MTPRWQDVRCASIPIENLAVLAELRRERGIRVTLAQGRAWVTWEDGPASELTGRVLVGHLLPLPGVEVFARRDGRWYRPGESLPAFHMPIGDGSAGMALDRLILPEPLAATPPDGEPPRAVRLGLVRDESGRPRPATAVRCRLNDLAAWVDRAPSTWTETLSAAWLDAPSGAPDAADVLILVAGASTPRPRQSPVLDAMPGIALGHRARAALPALADARRFWGRDVLVPLGHRAEPDLADRALRQAVGARPDELVVLDHDGPELIPRQAFRPLDRASIRLAGTARRARPALPG